ncbi:MAG: RNA-directed DNA polymerase [Desulfocapsaceae bacterium]|nr:RNA-directed DNA polymerase [Desulfocapsaceae bacterium]
MLDQTYSVENLLRLMKKSDPGKYRMGRERSDYKAFLSNLSSQISSPNFSLGGLRKVIIKNRDVFITSRAVDDFAIRKTNDNLRRIYKVKQSDRNKVVSQLLILSQEPVPYTLVKLDLRSFYESINKEDLVEKILSDTLPSNDTKKIIKSIFYNSSVNSAKGIPRGLSISATLSELFMRSFDKKVKQIPGVYYYARYVDDLVIMTTKSALETIQAAANCLPEKMIFNDDKTCWIEIDSKNAVKKNNCPNNTVTYLGYQIKIDLSSKSKRKIDLGISQKKINRTKQRIVLTIKDYNINNNFELLYNRIQFLTCNYSIEERRNASFSSDLKAGIFYSYPLLDGYDFVKSQLKKLDEFLNKQIWNRKGSIGSKLSGFIKNNQRRIISNLSFLAGFEHRKTKKFLPKQIKQMRKCWKYV